MRYWIIAVILVVLAACTPAQEQPLPTLAQLPTALPVTPTLESEGGSQPTDVPTPDDPGGSAVSLMLSGLIEGPITHAVLAVEAGSDYTLLFDQPEADNPVQLRLILAGNIEPGTYDIVPAVDFQRPEDALVAARFDLGFLEDNLSGTLTLTSIGENNFTGTLTLTAQSNEGTITVTGEFQHLNTSVIG